MSFSAETSPLPEFRSETRHPANTGAPVAQSLLLLDRGLLRAVLQKSELSPRRLIPV